MVPGDIIQQQQQQQKKSTDREGEPLQKRQSTLDSINCIGMRNECYIWIHLYKQVGRVVVRL